MCKEPAIRAPRSGCTAAYSLRIAMSPGISVSAILISFRPQSASLRSLTIDSLLTFIAAFMCFRLRVEAASGRTRRCQFGRENIRLVGTLPGELLLFAAKMAVSGGFLIDRPREIEHRAQPIGRQIEVRAHD